MMADDRWPEVRFRAMGCQMAAWLDAPPQVAEPALALVEPMMAHYEQVFSRFLPDSELSQLNAHPQEEVHVSETLFEVVEQALAMAENTGGLFDPTLLDELEAAGYDRDFAQLTFTIPTDGPQPKVAPPAQRRWRAVHLDSETRTITLPPNVRLDLGGIAKGWSAERVARVLACHGPCLVDAGGDLVAVGAPGKLPGWPVTIAEPGGERSVLNLWLRNASAATSGVDRRRWEIGGHLMHHLIDPRTGQPAQTDVETATVVAPDALQAEAWAKASLLLGAVQGAERLAAQEDMAGVLISDSGTVYHTSSMRRWLYAGN